MECLKSGVDIFLKRSIQTFVVNSHNVTYKPIAPAEILPSWNLIVRGIVITTLI